MIPETHQIAGVSRHREAIEITEDCARRRDIIVAERRLQPFQHSPSGSGKRASTFATTQPPLPPTLLSPADAGTSVNFTPTFDWTDTAQATSYTFQLSTSNVVKPDGSFQSTVSGFTGTATTSEFSPTGFLFAGTTYYWHVKANNTPSWSSIFSFTIAPLVCDFFASGPRIDARSADRSSARNSRTSWRSFMNGS